MCWTIDLALFAVGDSPDLQIREYLQNLSQAVDKAKLLVDDLSKSSV